MKKFGSIIFTLIFMAMLIIPASHLNIKKDQVSEIDNSFLPELEWEDDSSLSDKIAIIEEYINMRIGYRTQLLTAYQIVNDRAFGILEHPSYMYGRDGYIYLRYNSYLKDYQHINLKEKWAKHFAKAMNTYSDISHDHDAEFIYMFIPDKKTVYPEHFPSGVNIRGDLSRTDQVISELQKTDVDWFYCYDTLINAKERFPVANVKFDPAHWNENGAFVSINELYAHIREYYPEVNALDEDDYIRTKVLKPYLDESFFPINEYVPSYELKKSTAYDDTEWLDSKVETNPQEYRTRFVNKNASDKPSLLIFNDSYLMRKEKFFTENFSEVTLIHRKNILGPEKFAKYLEELDPDIVVYENPERVFPIWFDFDR